MSKGSWQRRTGRHRVAMIVSDGSNPFEMCAAVELFGIARPEMDRAWYEFKLCAPQPTVRLREGLFTVSCPGTLADAAAADTVIAPNRPDTDVAADAAVLEVLQAASRRGARLVSFCTGAFTLAEAGLLDGRTATTHWRWTDEFRRRYPEVNLRPDVLYVDDGDVLTSAGSAAAFDLCLHIIRNDHGAAVANVVSRRLVFPGNRDGGQQQFIERPAPPPAGTSIGDVLAWASAHLRQPLTVADLARRAAMSPTSLHRRFRAETGTTPLRWLLAERVDYARALLETTDLSVEAIATECGFGTPANMRTHFRRHAGLTPTDYRRASSEPSGRQFSRNA